MDAMLLLKTTAVLLIALFAGRLLRHAPAATRHRYWSVVFAGLLILPVLVLALPALVFPVPRLQETSVAAAFSPSEVVTVDRVAAGSRPVPSPGERAAPISIEPAPQREFSMRTLLLFAWGIGTSLAMATLFLSLWRVRRLSCVARELGDARWTEAAEALAQRVGFRRSIRLLASDLVTTPMASGVWRPTVFLPASCRQWTSEQRDIVLAHEISHMASRDPLRLLLTRLTVALYWFHPLTWLAARSASTAREEACDAAVLALGTRPSIYARVLLDLAESLQPRPRMLAALWMVQHSLLETRLMTILKGTRTSTHRLALIPMLVFALLTVVIAAAEPGAQAVAAIEPAITPQEPAAPTAPRVMPAPPATPARASSRTNLADGNRSSDPCWASFLVGDFEGSITESDAGGRTVLYERVGRVGNHRVIQKRFGDLRLCLVAKDIAERTPGLPSQWLGEASHWQMEVRRSGIVQRLESSGGALSWTVGGRERSIDAGAERWRQRMLAVLDTTWELSTLKGQVSSLRGEISSIYGERSSLQGEISSLQGQLSSLRGEISSILGQESSMRGEISSILGHVSSLRGQISSEQGAISSLNASGNYRATASEREAIASIIRRHEAEIARIEQQIRDYDADARVAAVERRIVEYDSRARVAKVEAEIRAFTGGGKLAGRVADLERRIEALDVDSKVEAIERKIDALDAERRTRELEDRQERQLNDLRREIE